MRTPETCECRYSTETEELTWCLGCREAEEARKVTPRPGRLARLRAWLTERKGGSYRTVEGPARFDLIAGTPVTLFGQQAYLVDPAQAYVRPDAEKALAAMVTGWPRWKWLAARLAYGVIALVLACSCMTYAYEAWKAQEIGNGLIPAAWFYAMATYATARKARHPFRPVLLRVW